MAHFDKYTVVGEYGPLSSQAISKRYRAASEENARKRFIREVKRENKWLWETRIGEHNVYVMKGWI